MKYSKFEEIPKNKYNVIYVDPPWSYSNNFTRGAAEKHYSVMNIEELKKLDINSISTQNSCLFLWTTWIFLPSALELIKSWNFKYKTIGFNWIKINKKSNSLFWGLGNWTRSNFEICLLALKGKPKRIAKNIHSVCISKIERHSKKPDEIRKRIENLCENGNKIELFARQSVDGWDCFGDEID